MSRFNAIVDELWPRAWEFFLEETTRRIGGSTIDTEIVDAVVDLDTRKAASSAVRAGLIDNELGVSFERACLVEMDATQAVETEDKWVIQGELWDPIGPDIRSDATTQGSKTIIMVRQIKKRGRQSDTSYGIT